MFILERLISSSCRSLAAMIGFARSKCGRGRGGHAGSPDDWARMPFRRLRFPRLPFRPVAPRFLPRSFPATSTCMETFP